MKMSSLGDYIREQRELAQVSLRQLAQAAGVSNPYLSQIERGLKKPSAEILQQIATGLRISAETLYVRAGLLDERPGAGPGDVVSAILADTAISDRHKRTLLDIYESFRAEHAASADPQTSRRTTVKAAPRKAAKTTAKKTTAKKTTRSTTSTPRRSR